VADPVETFGGGGSQKKSVTFLWLVSQKFTLFPQNICLLISYFLHAILLFVWGGGVSLILLKRIARIWKNQIIIFVWGAMAPGSATARGMRT